MAQWTEKTEDINEQLTLTSAVCGLTFGTDAYLLSAYVRRRPHGRAVDLGSGTGVIALLCASRGAFARIHAVELQPEFGALIARNAADNDLSDRIVPVVCDVRSLTAADVGGEVDAVFSNPPYMRAGAGFGNTLEALEIARHEVCGGIGDFCACAYRLLKHGGKFYAVWRPDRLTDIIASMRENRLEPKIMTFVHADSDSIPSMVLISATKGGASGMRLTAPLMLYDGKDRSEMSEKAKKIYENMSFDE